MLQNWSDLIYDPSFYTAQEFTPQSTPEFNFNQIDAPPFVCD